MLTYLSRRVAQLLVILLASSFFVYNLEAIAGDPLEEIKLSSDPKKAQTIVALTRQLDLNTPPPIRFFKWLGGIISGLWGDLQMGKARTGQSVAEAIGNAVPTTIRLVLAATIIAIVLGITIGVITALRQYSRFDYAVTFISFLFFSLPIFWVAVLLKQFLSIGFNDWLANPILDWPWLVGFGIVSAIFWAGVIGGDLRRIAIVSGTAFTASAGFAWLLSATGWFASPVLGPIFIGVGGLATALLITTASTGLSNKPARNAALTMVAVGLVIYYPVQLVLTKNVSGWVLIGLAVLTVLVGLLAGYFFAKEDRAPVMRTSAITAVVIGGMIFFDRLMQEWVPYVSNDFVSYRPIPTIGQTNDMITLQLNDEPDFWLGSLDSLLHIILPTIALTIISFAGYVRYTRGNLLEVLNMDYIRTARAKGLTERTVVMRHAFRNSLIPLTTLMAWDFAGILGGAIITESVFGWTGMGTLFRVAIVSFDLNLLMGTFIITSTLAVSANLISDLLYSALDPRIRVGTGE
jgi:peptide/nickel transport system permease protein